MNLLAIIPIALLVVDIASSPALFLNYTGFQNCLFSAEAEVGGDVTEQQTMDCLDSTYGQTNERANSGDSNGDSNGGSDVNGGGAPGCGGGPSPR